MVQILGVHVIDETFQCALERLDSLLRSSGDSAIYFVNAHTLNCAAADPAYRRVLNRADIVYGDGTGVRWAALCRGIRLRANLNGTDLVPAFLQRGRPLRCYLVGGTPDAIERGVGNFCRKFPSCTLVGWHHGYLDAASSKDVVASVNAAQADVLLVGMGNPLQEEWIDRYRADLKVKLCIGVGGLFSYFAGDLDRAPLWLRRWGLEFVHIVRRQPAKLRRHLWGDPLFLLRMLLWLPSDLQGHHVAASVSLQRDPAAAARY